MSVSSLDRMKPEKHKKKILAVIPARGGSKGVPGKNIRVFGGRPLISYIIDSAKQSEYIDELIVSTDDERIAEISKSFGADVPFLRPGDLATDTALLKPVLKHALDYFDKLGFEADCVLSLQPTDPFIETKTIDDAIGLWLKTNCDSVTTIAEFSRGHPYIAKRLKRDNVIEAFCSIPENEDLSRRQTRERAYYLTGGLYLRSRRLMVCETEKGDFHCLGKDARGIVVSEIESVDINSEFDALLVEFIIEKGLGAPNKTHPTGTAR